MALDIKITRTTAPKAKPDPNKLGFGVHFTDHMFVMDYTEGKGWHDARIVPYAPIEIDPSAMVLHYGQAIFEGMKAYKADGGKVTLFRPDMNAKRSNRSSERICIPAIPEEDFIQAVAALVKVDSDWIPKADGTALYIRPFSFSTDPFLGVRPSNTYKFVVILSPVGAYYPEGVNPVKIYIETDYVRAVRGGIGFTKASANYAISLAAQVKANHLGYTQVLWLDGVERKYIEEVGTMNVMFKIDGKIVTPSLGGSILPGITRDSCITALRSMGYEVEERRLSVDELYEASQNGKLEEAFGVGTAAVISPIGEIVWGDKVMRINDFKTGEVSQKLYDYITGIQTGKEKDIFNWVYEVK